MTEILPSSKTSNFPPPRQNSLRKSRSSMHIQNLNSIYTIILSTTATASCIQAKAIVVEHHAASLNGLVNLGNTCYLNAQLQCAYHIPLVRNLILSSPLNDEDEVVTDDTDNEISVALQSLQQVFSTISSDYNQPGTTRALCNSLGINVWEQQDSQEFWKLLLPQLELSPLTDLYQGCFEDYIIAQDGSGRERRREELFLDLSLEVDSGSVISSLTSMFTESELLKVSEGNGWKPSDDSSKVDAKKGSHLSVHGLPSILHLHLKRFQYDWSTDTMSKIKKRFTFPDLLDLSEVCTDVSSVEDNLQSIYDLQSIIIHRGEFGSGHYYSYVRPNIRTDEWFRINDEIVTPVSYEEVIADAFGGSPSKNTKKRKKRGLFSSIFGDWSGEEEFGWGGRTSCAYVLQYMKRWDVDRLYCTTQG